MELLNNDQSSALIEMRKVSKAAVHAHRCWGKTTLAISYAIDEARNNDGVDVIFVVPKYGMKQRVANLIQDNLAEAYVRPDKIVLPNQSVIHLVAPRSTMGYSRNALVIIDEVLGIPEQELDRWLNSFERTVVLFSGRSASPSMQAFCKDNLCLRYPYEFDDDRAIAIRNFIGDEAWAAEYLTEPL